MRTTPALLLLAIFFHATFFPEALLQGAESGNPPIIEPSEHAAITALMDAVIKAGFPDAKTLTLYHGELKVRATNGPHGEEPLLPCDASQMQETTDSGVAYRFTFSGLHAKTPTDSWLIAFNYNYAPRPTDEVTTTALTVLDPATLTATAGAARPFDAAKQATEWLAKLGPADQQRLIATMDRLVPVSFQLKISPDNWPAAAILLKRAGWVDADLAGLSIADQRARLYWHLRPWSNPDQAFDPTCVYASLQQEEQAWSAAQTTLTLESPTTALRRALYRFCKAQINRDDQWLNADVAAACCRACLDPLDPQGNTARIAALRAARDLPLIPPAAADLVARLQSWEGAPRRPRMSVNKGKKSDAGKPDDQASVSISTSFSSPAPAYEPQASDLDALVALLADSRPSRWLDFSGARTIGDNAWRALAMLLKKDPRTLAGLATNTPWTTAERTTTALAFQKWWKINGQAQRVAAERPTTK